ncbi:MAG TPA: cytochrome c [Afipia sp.]
MTGFRVIINLLALGLLFISSEMIQAADAQAGRRKARACAACHGIDGLSKMPMAPNIAGSPAMYLEKQLQAFRSGERKDDTMSLIAKPLSDDDIADIAAWYSGLGVEVKVPN